jgi:hypothetical protein
MRAPLARGVAIWNRFWFEADGRAQTRVFRIGFGLLLLVFYSIRTMDFNLFYGEGGLMPVSILSDVAPMEYRFSIFRYLTSDTALWIGNWVFLASLLALILGIRPRLSVLLTWFLHVSFVHRDLGIAYGADMISCFFLFFLCMADHRSDREYRPGDLQATLGSMAYRLCQIQVCVIYGFSGLKKLKGVTWWSGEAIWNSLSDPQLARWDFSWASHFPLALAFTAYLTIAWEVYFPALIWVRPIRKPLLLIGILLHLGIAVSLCLSFFSLLMVLTYSFFLDREVLGAAEGWVRRQAAKFKGTAKVPAPVSD